LAEFSWRAKIANFWNRTVGKLVPRLQVQRWANASIAAVPVGEWAKQLVDGTLDVGTWQEQMRGEIKREYIRQYLIGKGGLENMTPADWGSIGGSVAEQYKWLDRFAEQIASGEEASEGRIRRRSEMYINSAREALERAKRRAAEEAEQNEVWWKRDPDAESCADCEDFEDMGWMPVDPWPYVIEGRETTPGQGDTICKTSCRCGLRYRKRRTAQKGGPGSGHFGHVGRPGKVGGSQPGQGRRFSNEVQQIGPVKGRWTIPETTVTFDDDILLVRQQQELVGNVRGQELTMGTRDSFAEASGRYEPGVLTITKLHVDQQIRGQGVATALMKRLVESAPAGYTITTTGVFSGGGRAVAERLVRDGWATKTPDGNYVLSLPKSSQKGGPGSGHFGHVGRPGKVGGSLLGNGGGAASSSGGKSPQAMAKAIQQLAERYEPEITKAVVDAVQANGGEMAGLEFRLKSEESLARKIKGYVEEKGVSPEEAQDLVKDAVRYTALLNAENYVEGAKAVHQALAEKGWKPYDHATKNYWRAGDSYDGYNCVFVNDQGVKMELQFHTPESIKVKAESHKIYEVARQLPPGPEYSSMVKQMVGLWGSVARPRGWESLSGVVK